MTQQGASKAVAELETLGYVERFADPGDARIRRVRFTPRGWDALETARRIRAEVDARLDAAHGPERMADLRTLLAEVLDTLGGTDAVHRRSVRPPT
jgi:DNA-binding MarR family transcriptional regulator